MSCTSSPDDIGQVQNPPFNMCDYAGDWHSYNAYKNDNGIWIQYPFDPNLNEEKEHTDAIRQFLDTDMTRLDIDADPVVILKDNCDWNYLNLINYHFTFNDDCLNYQFYSQDSTGVYFPLSSGVVERHGNDIMDFDGWFLFGVSNDNDLLVRIE